MKSHANQNRQAIDGWEGKCRGRDKQVCWVATALEGNCPVGVKLGVVPVSQVADGQADLNEILEWYTFKTELLKYRKNKREF